VIAGGGFSHEVAYGLLKCGNPRLLWEAKNAGAAAWVRAAREFADAEGMDQVREEFVLGRLWNASEELRRELRDGVIGRFMKFAAVALDPSPREAEAFPLENVRAIGTLPHLHNEQAEIQACTFMVIVGLTRRESVAAQLLREGFATVYGAAAEGSLSWDLWRRLERLVPWHIFEWDRCARLIEAAASRFADREWPADQFFATFLKPDQFERAISVLRSTHRLEYFQALKRDMRTATTEATDFQRSHVLSIEW
jgi:hypothetical protein